MPKFEAEKDANFDIIEQLFQSEYDNMVDFAAYLLQSASLAEVAVQDTFVYALSKRAALQSSPNPTGWLYETLKHVILHMQRDRRALLKKAVQLDTIPEHQLATEDSYETLPLDKNDPELKLLIRFYIYGYSLKELAEEDGVTVGAVKMRIRRAKQSVKKKFQIFLNLALLFAPLMECIK